MIPTYLMLLHYWTQLSGLCPGLTRIPVDTTLHLKKTPPGVHLVAGLLPWAVVPWRDTLGSGSDPHTSNWALTPIWAAPLGDLEQTV